jgi:hypothetical protein
MVSVAWKINTIGDDVMTRVVYMNKDITEMEATTPKNCPWFDSE